MPEEARMHIHAASRVHTRGQPFSTTVLSAGVWTDEVLPGGLAYSSSTALLKLYWFSISSEIQTEVGKHHIIFLLYNFQCSWQILLSRSKDRCFFVFPLLSNDEKTEFFWQPLSFYFLHPCYHLFPLRRATIHVYYPQRRCPSPAQSFSAVYETGRMHLMRSVEQCETLLSVKLMPLCSPEQSVSVSLLSEQWDIWISSHL